MHEQARQVRVQVAATGVSGKLGSIWWSFLLRGLFAIALGLFALFWPALSLSVLVIAVGIYCLVDGAAGLVGAFLTYLASRFKRLEGRLETLGNKAN